jgi:bacterioferritin (cytochrome b1)
LFLFMPWYAERERRSTASTQLGLIPKLGMQNYIQLQSDSAKKDD